MLVHLSSKYARRTTPYRKNGITDRTKRATKAAPIEENRCPGHRNESEAVASAEELVLPETGEASRGVAAIREDEVLAGGNEEALADGGKALVFRGEEVGNETEDRGDLGAENEEIDDRRGGRAPDPKSGDRDPGDVPLFPVHRLLDPDQKRELKRRVPVLYARRLRSERTIRTKIRRTEKNLWWRSIKRKTKKRAKKDGRIRWKRRLWKIRRSEIPWSI